MRRIAPAPQGYAVRATLSARWSRAQPAEDNGRGVKLFVHSGRPVPGDELAQVSLFASGRVELNVRRAEVATAHAALDPTEDLEVELRAGPAGTELRVWPAGTARPHEALLRSRRAFLAPRFLGFEASNLVGATLLVDAVELAPLPAIGEPMEDGRLPAESAGEDVAGIR
jgi:hypothetical protein